MFLKSRRSVAATAVSLLIGTALIAPAAAPAKTVSFKMVETSGGPASGANLKVIGKVKGTLGSGTMRSTTVPPKTTGQWKLKGGTIRYTFTTTLNGTAAKGSGKITGGTGKFKGIKGKFSVKGDIRGTTPWVYTGKATL